MSAVAVLFLHQGLENVHTERKLLDQIKTLVEKEDSIFNLS